MSGNGGGEIRDERKGEIIKELEETFEDNGNVNFLDCGDGFIGICEFLSHLLIHKLQNKICNH